MVEAILACRLRNNELIMKQFHLGEEQSCLVKREITLLLLPPSIKTSKEINEFELWNIFFLTITSKLSDTIIPKLFKINEQKNQVEDLALGFCFNENIIYEINKTNINALIYQISFNDIGSYLILKEISESFLSEIFLEFEKTNDEKSMMKLTNFFVSILQSSLSSN